MPRIVIGLCVNTDRFLRYLEYLVEGINAPLGMNSLRGNMNVFCGMSYQYSRVIKIRNVMF